jgi:hypothetical protein
MSFGPGVPFFSSPLAVFAADFVSTLTSSSNLTTYNLGDVVIPADGLVVVVLSTVGNSSVTLSSITVGGTAATILATTANNTAVGRGLVEKAAGTHNLTVVLSGARGTSPGLVVTVYLLQNANVTPLSTVTYDHANASSRTITLTTVDGGFAIYTYCIRNNNDAGWSQGTSLYDNTVSGYRHEHRLVYPTTDNASFSNVITTNNGSNGNAALGCSFGPP